MNDLPEGALEVHTAALADYVSSRLDDIGDRIHPDDSRDALEAALGWLASAPKGRGYLLRLVFGEQELSVLRAAVELTYPHPGSAVASTHSKLRCAVEPPTEEPLP